MANTENRSNPSIQDALGNFYKFQQDNLKVNRDYNQVMVKNIADLGTYQKNLMNENMDIRRKAHSMRMFEALAMAEKETDDTKLQVYLDRINEARKGLSSTVDWRGGREFEGETPLMTMHELRRHKTDYDAKLAFDKRDAGGVNLADRLSGYGSGSGGVKLTEENTTPASSNQSLLRPWDMVNPSMKHPALRTQEDIANNPAMWYTGKIGKRSPFVSEDGLSPSNPAELIENYLAHKSDVAGQEYDNANTRWQKLIKALKYGKYKTIEYGNSMFSPASNAQRAQDMVAGTYDWFNEPLNKE